MSDVRMQTANEYWAQLGYAGPPTPRKNPEPLYVGETDLGANRPTFHNPESLEEAATQESVRASLREWLDRYWPSAEDIGVRLVGGCSGSLLSPQPFYDYGDSTLGPGPLGAYLTFDGAKGASWQLDPNALEADDGRGICVRYDEPPVKPEAPAKVAAKAKYLAAGYDVKDLPDGGFSATGATMVTTTSRGFSGTSPGIKRTFYFNDSGMITSEEGHYT